MQGQRTDLATAATVKAMSEAGYSPSKISSATGVGLRTVHDIAKDQGVWANMQDDRVFSEYRRQAKRTMQAESIEVAKLALNVVRTKIDQASPYQAAGIYGLLRDKERLDAGEPTTISASYTVHELKDIDKLAALLGKSLVGTDADALDVAVVSSSSDDDSK